MRASRLLTLQMLLQTRGRMSARELAQTLEVSERTLHRDIDQLSAAGVPVYAERGRAGGFELMPGWQTKLTGLTASEAQAVFLSGLAGPAAQLGLGQPMQDAQLKLAAALPAGQRQLAQQRQERFHLDTLDWYRDSESVPHLTTVAEAVWQGLVIQCRYESWKSISRQGLHPLGLVLKAGRWYLVALPANPRSKTPTARTYRVAGMQEVTLGGPMPAASRPRSFNLAQYWQQSIERFERELYSAQAVVLATSAGVGHLRQLSGVVAAALAHLPTSRRRDGRLRLRIPMENTAYAASLLLRMAPDVEVLEPPALVDAIRDRVGMLARFYRV